MVPTNDNFVEDPSERVFRVCRRVVGVAAYTDTTVSTVRPWRAERESEGLITLTVVRPRLISLATRVFANVTWREIKIDVRHTESTSATDIAKRIFGTGKVTTTFHAATIAVA